MIILELKINMTNYDHIIKELHTHIEAINTSDDLYHFLVGKVEPRPVSQAFSILVKPSA